MAAVLDRRRKSSLVAGAYLFTVVMAGNTVPTPLYSLYAQRLSLNPLIVSSIAVAYAPAVMVALLFFGRLSDGIGRRAVCLLACGLSVASSLLFAFTVDLSDLYLGRVLSGLAVGLLSGAATTYLTELHPDEHRGSLVAAMANLGGLAVGPALGAVVSVAIPEPTRWPYLVQVCLLAPALYLIVGVETSDRSITVAEALRPQKLGVPSALRRDFTGAAIGAVVGFAILGFTSGLIGQLLSAGLSDKSRLTAGLSASLLLISAVTAQLVSDSLGSRRSVLSGLAVLPVGAVLITLALPLHSVATLEVGLVVCGVGIGLTFRSGQATVTENAPDERRAEVVSTFFIVAYAGLVVPVLAAGALIVTTTLFTAVVSLAIFVALLSSTAFVILARR